MTSLLFRALARLPLPVLYALGHALHVLVFHVVRWRVPLARGNLAGAFPELAAAVRERILRDSYLNLSRTLMEAIWGYRASGEALTARVRFDNPELIERYKAARSSVVLLTAHTCNWEWLLLAAGARFGIPIDAVYKPLRLAGVDAYVREARSRFGGRPIPFRNFLFELMRRAHEPRAYAMVADQTPLAKMPKFWTTFLNRDTAFFLGPERIARYLDAPVLYVEMTRVRRGHYAVRLHVLAEPPYEDDVDAGPVIAQRYARALEATIRAHPADWLWIHNKWKYPRPAVDEGYDRRRRRREAAAQRDGAS
ncbi:MAG: lysophospholipid acyltransferase family protein [Burkholderiales bacterium]|nr:lysophospholipid acyltransferase family protein [Burkholderiales bacterium]